MPQTEIALAFADGEYRFRLGLAQIAAIEDKCGPIGEVYSRLMRGRYIQNGQAIGNLAETAFRVADLMETVRQGLIGGGGGIVDGAEVRVDLVRANALVQLYVAERPLVEGWCLAVAIMSALMEGFTPPKPQPAEVAGAKKKRTMAA